MKDKEKIRVTASFPVDIHQKLIGIADKQHRSVSSLIVQFCSEKIEETENNTRMTS
ncbi:MAG: ribbon-helix-helix domain-containing protein [Sphaerospermopsis kisseleviana]